MNLKKKVMIVSGVSGAIGGGLGAVCGSNSLFVVFCVGAVSAVVVSWLIGGFLK